MDQLAKEQDKNLKEIEAIISNHKKDSAERRKKPGYFEKRLQKLEAAWKRFEETDYQIKALPNLPLDHAYFTKQVYDVTMSNYDTFRQHFLNQITYRQGDNQGAVGNSPDSSDDEPGFQGDDNGAVLKSQDVKSSTYNLPSANQPTKENNQGGAIPRHQLNQRTDKRQGNNSQPTPSELTRLLRKQRGITDSVQRFLATIDLSGQNQPREYFQVKYAAVEKYWSQLQDINQGIWEFSDDPAADGYDISAYVQLEETIQEYLIQLSTKLQELPTAAIPASSSTNAMLQLPKITLPKFDGDYLKWRQFYDLFVQMVHNQPMANCQKMWYLKTNLSGEAEKLVRHLSLSEENYTAAFKMLKERYDNPRLLVAALVNKLLSQPSHASDSPSTAAIKALHDTTKECLMGLENLKVPTNNWDPLLLHILIRKLDKTTHALYEQTLENPRSLQTINGLLEFLENRFQSLEALGNKGRGLEEQKRTTFKSTSVNLVTSLCIVCKGTHPLFACKSFLQMSPGHRLNLLRKNNLCINCLRGGHAATSCTLRGCTKCSKKHNSLVHLERTTPTVPPDSSKSAPVLPAGLTMTSNTSQPTTLATLSRHRQGYVLLSTARVKLINDKGVSIECRAILDSGSQINLITERVTKKLNLPTLHDALLIQGIGRTTRQAQRRINVKLQSRLTNFSTRLEAFVLPQIISPQPTQPLDTSTWAIPHNIPLADPNFDRPERIDLLIGAEFYHQLLSIGQIKLANDLPSLQNTVFGWILSGRVGRTPITSITCGIGVKDDICLNESIERFWKIEDSEGASTPNLTQAEKLCETHFNQTVKRNTSGRFVVRLPFAEDPSKLGDSKTVATQRFLALERKLSRDTNLRLQYEEFMNEYIQLKHMEEIDIQELPYSHYFLPHHCVLKPDSSTTKLRVVFDASAKTSSNISLNDILHTGPTVQDDLFAILLRFRLPRFVFTADIQKMYRQIELHEEDRNYQLILWRKGSTEPMKCYRLNTVTYGTRSAPYLATKCLQKLAQEGASKYPLGAKILQKNFYVDDVITGSDSLAELIEGQTQITQLLQGAGFKLRKWCSNHPRLLKHILPEDQEIQLDFQHDVDEYIKTLGLTWLPATDDFSIKTAWCDERKITKRTVSSDIARLFDPLGIMGPVIVTAKMFLQELWQLKLDWDASLPIELHTRWSKFRESLRALNDIKTPRHIFAHEFPKTIQLHVFADASEKAYGSAIYIRSTNKEGRVIVRLLCAKSKVAPIKKITLPRLELCAAKMATELTNRVKRDLNLEEAVTHYWTDSEIVLNWINSVSSVFQTFVANRISYIQGLSIPQQWRHVGSRQNPADILSRGITPEKLKDCHLWFYGPPFLHGRESTWPPLFNKNLSCDLEKKRSALPITATAGNETSTHFIERVNHGNSFRRLQRVTAYILRFIQLVRKRELPIARQQALTTQELDEALYFIIKFIQQDEFKEDIAHLQQYREVNKGSSISSLAPFLDERGVLRVGGRLEAAELSYDAKHPSLLPYSHPLTKNLMTEIHKENMHIGPQGLLAITRQRFWPIKGKSLARSIVQHCIQCARANPKLLSQMMGNLPSTRVQPARPFVNSGVDFCGPIWIHFRIRGKRPQKAYLAVFCCFATKAVHLELVSDLTTEAFIGALRRFIGRRGHCKNLYCDNATNFVGARNQLEELKKGIYSPKATEDIISACSKQSIDFHFIPPRAPHFGGLWEAAVKSAKHLLQRSVSTATLTYEELETVIIEVEAILNSRPLTTMSSDPNDLTALTPGHFLIGEPLTSSIDSTAEPMKVSLLSRWKLVAHIKNEFWRRWSHEYLNELQYRFKWKQRCQNVQPGTIVIIKEDNVPVSKWPLGRVIQTYKGEDGCVRVADLKTATGTLRRPIHKLAPLPCEEDSSENKETLSKNEGLDPLKRRQYDHSEQHTHEKSAGETKDSSISRSETDKEQIPRKRRKATYGSSLLSILLTCMILPIIKGEPVEIHQLENKPGIHFEGIGTLSLATTRWALVVYYDLKPYWLEHSVFTNGTNALQHLCDQIPQKSSCKPIVQQFKHIEDELSQDNQLLEAKSAHERSKRSPLNIVGNVANALFGVLDSEYAKEMSETIKRVNANEEHLLHLLRNQTSIIDSTVNIIKKDQLAVSNKFKALDDQLKQIINRLKDTNEDSYANKLMNIFMSLSIQLTLLASNLHRIQSSILDVITDAHHGRISALLLSPQQLRKEMVNIRAHLPASLRLPFVQDNILQAYRLMTTRSQIIDNHIIFQLQLPLVNLMEFDLFELFPVPVLINNTFAIIKPHQPILAISPHRDEYYPLSKNELSSCTIMDKSTYLCEQSQPLYHKGANISACEIGLLNNIPTPTKCELRKVQDNSIWIQIKHSNKWIFGLTAKTTLNVVCDQRVLPINLEGSGLLKLQPDCIIKHDHITIRGRHIYTSTFKTSYTKLTAHTQMELPKRVEKLAASTPQYNLSLADLDTIKEVLNSQELASLPNNVDTHVIHQHTVGYLALTLAVGVIIWLTWKGRPRTCQPTKPKPAPRHPRKFSLPTDNQDD